MKITLMATAMPLFVCMAAAQPAAMVPTGDWPGHPIALSAESSPLPQVRLLDGPFHDAMVRDENYLLSLDCDRLLYNFRVNANLPTEARPYGGWEAPKCELRGHSVGHYLSACSLMYANTGDTRFKERVDRIVDGFAECQTAWDRTRRILVICQHSLKACFENAIFILTRDV